MERNVTKQKNAHRDPQITVSEKIQNTHVAYRLSVRDGNRARLTITRLDAPRLRMGEDLETLAVPAWWGALPHQHPRRL